MEKIYNGVQWLAVALKNFAGWVTYPVTLMVYFADCLKNCPKPTTMEFKAKGDVQQVGSDNSGQTKDI